MLRTVVTLYLLFVFVATCAPPKWIVPRISSDSFDDRFHFDVPHEKPSRVSGGRGFA